MKIDDIILLTFKYYIGENTAIAYNINASSNHFRFNLNGKQISKMIVTVLSKQGTFKEKYII